MDRKPQPHFESIALWSFEQIQERSIELVFASMHYIVVRGSAVTAYTAPKTTLKQRGFDINVVLILHVSDYQ